MNIWIHTRENGLPLDNYLRILLTNVKDVDAREDVATFKSNKFEVIKSAEIK